eukprot:TRINITY_DN27491_c0_g1_i1.p1 TRINITY_DN27491_c0_g1~~TRINITY_DN27491_c0_g1_i1.p1  ORF type:complete len:351 (-),score=81.23 TRINITY_DN27491_c0_g1_i1:54-1076(-)
MPCLSAPDAASLPAVRLEAQEQAAVASARSRSPKPRGARGAVDPARATLLPSPLSRALPSGCSRFRQLVGFDFDCTLTVRHFFKVFAHGFLKGDMTAHPHCAAFGAWCKSRRLPVRMVAPPPGIWAGNAMGAALEAFCCRAGEEGFRQLFREVFLGGDERIRLVADALARLQRAGAELCIVTAGSSGAVLRALAAVPEWRPFFPPSLVWDVSQARHKAGSVMAMKALMLRDLRPAAERIVLVDDSLERDPPPAWALEVAEVVVDVCAGSLPYEGSGLGESALASIERWLAEHAEGAEARGGDGVVSGCDSSCDAATGKAAAENSAGDAQSGGASDSQDAP